MIWRAAACALIVLAQAAAAAAPEESQLPVPRAAADKVEAPADPALGTPEAPEAPEAAQDTAQKPEDPPDNPAVPLLLAETDADFVQCLDDLRQIGVKAKTADPVRSDDPACGIERPVTVSLAAPGVRLEPEAVMRCGTARALGIWVRDFLIPATRLIPDRERLTAIDHGSAYVCRRRNNAPDGEPSEHSYGNALDIMGFHFAEGPPIAVQPREREGSFAEAFQDAARATACLSFTTVLGPGSDAAHADHLHLDILERRGGFRLCQ